MKLSLPLDNEFRIVPKARLMSVALAREERCRCVGLVVLSLCICDERGSSFVYTK
jgi:hypothetical protein